MKKIFSFSKSQNIKTLFCTQKFFSSAVCISCLLLTANCQLAFSQPPQGINYQAVARDASGNPLASQTVAVTFRIRQTSSTGTVVYRGAETYTTNQFGLFTALIGQTASDSGNFSSISWGSDVFYLQVLVNGNNMGATQFMSVPYALYAGNSPAWNLSGNTASFGQYFGTNNSLDLVFKTNNLERMRIDSTTGFVGINANPGYRLHIGGGGTGSSSPSFGLNEYNVRQWVIGAGFTVTNKLSIRNATLGVDAITIDSANQVGIGTTSPAAKLEVVHTTTVTADAGKFTLNTSASGVKSAIYADVVGTGGGNIFGVYGRSENQAVTISNAAVKGLATGSANATVRYGGDFSANGPGTNFGISAMATGAANNNIGGYFSAFGGTTNYAAIFDQGNVGIGTATPGAKLEIVGSSGATIKIADGNQGANKVLTSDAIGQGSWQTPATSAPGFSNMQVYSTAGTFTFTTGASVTRVMVEVWGGGGGGGGSSAGCCGGGGGGGGYGKEILTVIPSTNYTLTVGVSGAGGLANNVGGNGGTSSFGSITATGGTGGGIAGMWKGGSGGTSSTTFSITGGNGGSYAGGEKPFYGGSAGMGGIGGTCGDGNNSVPTSGTAPGGGGGGNNNNSNLYTGASGANGRVVVWW